MYEYWSYIVKYICHCIPETSTLYSRESYTYQHPTLSPLLFSNPYIPFEFSFTCFALFVFAFGTCMVLVKRLLLAESNTISFTFLFHVYFVYTCTKTQQLLIWHRLLVRSWALLRKKVQLHWQQKCRILEDLKERGGINIAQSMGCATKQTPPKV